MPDPREAALTGRLHDIAGPEPSPGERALMARLIRSFLAKTPGMLDHLELLLATADPAAALIAAHALRGKSANIGADGLARLAAAVEDEIRAGRPPGPESVAALRAETEAVRPLLTAAAARLTAPD